MLPPFSLSSAARHAKAGVVVVPTAHLTGGARSQSSPKPTTMLPISKFFS